MNVHLDNDKDAPANQILSDFFTECKSFDAFRQVCINIFSKKSSREDCQLRLPWRKLFVMASPRNNS